MTDKIKNLTDILKLAFKMLSSSFEAVGEFLYRHDAHNCISKSGMILLNDKEELSKVLNALRYGKDSVITDKGTYILNG